MHGLHPLRLMMFTAVVILAIGGLMLWPIRTLVIIDEGGRVAFRSGVRIGEVVTIGYIHSVEKTPVYSYFTVAPGNDLIFTRMRFQSFGSGLPYTAPVVRHLDGWVEYSGFDHAYPSMTWNVRGELGHVLVVRGKRIYLDSLVANHSNITFEVVFQAQVTKWLASLPALGR